MLCAREYSFNDENRKTFKRASARHLLHILPVGRITFKSSFSVPAHRRNSVESSFQNSLRNFFRRLESYIAGRELAGKEVIN
jgi:hypothetical protein